MAIVAHELRGPMAALDASLLLLESELRQSGALSSRSQTLLERATRNTSLVNRIIGDLLEIVRLDLGEVPLRRRSVDLVPMIEEVVASLAPAEQERVTLVPTPARETRVSCDPDRMIQVFSNLVRNALQHGRGQIEIRLSQADGGHSVSFENDGDVATDLQQRVFRPFIRGTQRGNGLGLGLYVVNRLIEAHAGTTSFQAANGRVRVTVVLPPEPDET